MMPSNPSTSRRPSPKMVELISIYQDLTGDVSPERVTVKKYDYDNDDDNESCFNNRTARTTWSKKMS